MLDLEFVLDQVDVLESKLEWAQDEVNDAITQLKTSLENFEKIKKEIGDISYRVKTKLS